MRKVMTLLAAGISMAFCAGQADAQVRISGFKAVPGVYGRPAWVSPYLGTPYYTTNTVLTPYGAATVASVGTTAQPLYSGPYHSIYFDSLANTYRYTSGYLNTPNVSSTLSVYNPSLYANPYLTNPYLGNPYLYANPYLVNPYLYP